MSKTIVLGDTHGRRLWQRATADNDFQRVIFIGDYFDSFDVPAEEQINNFKDICAFKKEQEALGKEVIMLIGNHDFQYMKEAGGETYSGYQPSFASSIGYVLTEEKMNMQILYEIEGILFTHAGISKTWMDDNGTVCIEDINEIFKAYPQIFRFNGWDQTGDNKTQGPLWIRPRSLLLDAIDGYTQVVGHTGMKHIIESPNKSVWFIDTVGVNQYLEIDKNLKFTIKQLDPLPKKPFLKYEDL